MDAAHDVLRDQSIRMFGHMYPGKLLDDIIVLVLILCFVLICFVCLMVFQHPQLVLVMLDVCK